MSRRLVARESGEWEIMMNMMKMKDGAGEKSSTAVVTKKRGYDITPTGLAVFLSVSTLGPGPGNARPPEGPNKTCF
ncbi:hypothetical protein C0J45_17562 [Silurus meridionalis]|nr:hypothetical protein C0J45_17562 [Silurus meridionalis]